MAQITLNSSGVASSGSLLLQTNGTTTQATVDTSGNLGLGVTPSAWSGFTALQIQNGALFTDSTSFRSIMNGYYNGSNWIYSTTNAATRYEQVNGIHRWFNAASGTAGNAISFTQAMTLDASGNLLVGTTASSSARLYVRGSGTTSATASFEASNSSGATRLYVQDDGTTRFFGSSGSETARIDSSGNLLVGISTYATTPASGVTVQTGNNASVNVGHTNSSSGFLFVNFGYNGGQIGSITQNGTTGVLYNLTSDYRLKNNPTPVTGAKEFVMALQPKTWDWWDGSGKGVGFIAHEFMEVAHYSGHGEKDAVDEDGNPIYQSIQPSSSEVMANLVAHIQELETRLAALENK